MGIGNEVYFPLQYAIQRDRNSIGISYKIHIENREKINGELGWEADTVVIIREILNKRSENRKTKEKCGRITD